MLSLIDVIYKDKHNNSRCLIKPTFGYLFVGQGKISLNTHKLITKSDRGQDYDYTDIRYILYKGKRYIFTGMMNNNYVCMFELDNTPNKTDIKIR